MLQEYVLLQKLVLCVGLTSFCKSILICSIGARQMKTFESKTKELRAAIKKQDKENAGMIATIQELETHLASVRWNLLGLKDDLRTVDCQNKKIFEKTVDLLLQGFRK